jgi:hypothetical protein
MFVSINPATTVASERAAFFCPSIKGWKKKTLFRLEASGVGSSVQRLKLFSAIGKLQSPGVRFKKEEMYQGLFTL